MSAVGFMKRRWFFMALCVEICICTGFGYAWSVFQTPLSQTHQWSSSLISLTYTITVLCSTMTPLLLGGVIRRLGTRRCILVGSVIFGAGLFCTGLIRGGVWQLYVTYGVLSGLGTGLIYPSVMAYVVRLYPERPGVASGIGTAAYGSGSVFWAPVAALLIANHSLSRTFQVFGVVFFVVIFVGAIFLREPPAELSKLVCMPPETRRKIEPAGLRRADIVRTPTFYGMVGMFTCGLVAGVIVISQASPMLQSKCAFPAEQAAVFVSVFAACNMAGRFFWGSMSDRISCDRVLKLLFAICAVAMLTLAFADGVAPVVILMAVAASCYGGFASVLTPLTSRVFGPKYITENYGVMYVVFGVASLIGPVLAVRFESGGRYTGAFAAAAILAVVGLVLVYVMKLTPHQTRKESYNGQ